MHIKRKSRLSLGSHSLGRSAATVSSPRGGKMAFFAASARLGYKKKGFCGNPGLTRRAFIMDDCLLQVLSGLLAAVKSQQPFLILL